MVAQKTTISRLTSTNSYVNLLLLVTALIGWTASIHNSCKEIDEENSYDEVNIASATDLALATFVLLAILGAVAILGLLSITKTYNVGKQVSILNLLDSVLGFVIFISIGLIVVGSISVNAAARYDGHTAYTDLSIIAFIGGFVPFILILASFLIPRYIICN